MRRGPVPSPWRQPRSLLTAPPRGTHDALPEQRRPSPISVNVRPAKRSRVHRVPGVAERGGEAPDGVRELERVVEDDDLGHRRGRVRCSPHPARLACMSPAGTRLWHPFAAMGKVDGHEFVLARGEGSRVWDADGDEYLDATAGLWFANVGHGRAEIADAVGRSCARSPPITSSATTPTCRRSSSRAVSPTLAPVEDAAVFFGSAAARRRHRREDRPPLLGAGRAAQRTSSSRAASPTTARTRTARRSPGIPAVRDGYGTLSRTSPRSPTTTRRSSCGRWTCSASAPRRSSASR